MRFRHYLVLLTLSAGILSACYSELNQPSTGVIQVTITGLPGEASAELSVAGPDGFTGTTDGSADLVGLAPGSYTISAPDVNVDINIYSPTEKLYTIDVTADGTTPIAVGYALSSGLIDVSIRGVPGSLTAAVVVTGPSSFARALTGNGLLTGLKAGTYAVLAAPIDSAGHVFAPAQALQNIVVEPGTNPQPITVGYGLATGQAAVTIAGVPNGSTAAVNVSGPNDYAAALTESGMLTRLPPGTYTVTAADLLAGGHTFAATGTTFDIVPSLVPVQSNVAYTQTTAELQITISGLPIGVNAAVDVSGPNGFALALLRTDTLVGLEPGTYTIDADSVNAGGFVYEPATATTTANGAAGAIANAEVTYSFTGSSSLDLTIPEAYLVQSIQRLDGDVPLIAGRDAYARVFMNASEFNNVAPSVRLRIYHGGSVVQVFDIDANRTDTPVSIAQHIVNNSWNILVPGNLIVEGMAMDVIADPTNVVPELNESNNTYPSDVAPQPIDVRTLAPFQLRFVPVLQGSSTGNVDTGNGLQFLDETQRMFPMDAVDWDVHAPMTTTAPVLMSGDQNNAWGTVLSEVRALRIAEGADHYYYGVVKVDYTSGVAGLGYVPSSPTSSSKASIGWDYLPSGSEIMAHELGHNFGRNHAPCGGPAGVDQNYPYPNAAIGHFGFDVAGGTLKTSALPDIMSYCNNPWVSDYTYEAILARREAEAAAAQPSATATSSLLVWGRIVDGSIVLEPAFELNQTPHLPSGNGPYTLEGVASDGSTAFSYRFAGEAVADLPSSNEQHFAFLIPHDAQTTPLSALRVTGAGGSVERTAPTGAAANAAVATTPLAFDRLDTDRIRIQWNTSDVPMVLVRDRASGQILAFARGGDAVVWTTSQDVELLPSDGIRSTIR